MGTEITLDVGGLSLTYAKNARGMDHGSLFQERDRKPVRSNQLDYDYYEREGEDPTSAEMAFERPLKDILPRLELLGFNLDRVRQEYERTAEIWRVERQSLSDDDSESLPDLMSFSEFRRFATEHPLASLDDTFVSDFDEESRITVRGRFADQAVANRIPNCNSYNTWANSERSYFGELVNILHPYSVMRLLAHGNANDNTSVVWQYGPLVDAGWATEREFISGATRREAFLIATEGSSDIHILKRALELLRPGIADFFRFIDVCERHPFPGTGNLVKFASGLVKIDVHNQIIFLLDNDAEGLDAYERLSRLPLPANMRAVMLPELEVFRTFPAQGPEGIRDSDINRKAAALECYLDLDAGEYPSAKVRWTNYKESVGVYHGALEYKKTYADEFLRQRPQAITGASYDTSKIEVILDTLLSECTAMALDQWRSAN
ncbi:MAG: HEPN/Toprim-associated domain-containing protein [Deltaproteobacteria bacterium]|nr:HEPN/Toprim-associated domain-containing protein [Deltaproteobacteria bacterium]